MTDNTIRTITVTDPSFDNVGAITDFLIPARDLPPFASFITSVAVKVRGVMGPYSEYSQQTTYTPEGEREREREREREEDRISLLVQFSLSSLSLLLHRDKCLYNFYRKSFSALIYTHTSSL